MLTKYSQRAGDGERPVIPFVGIIILQT